MQSDILSHKALNVYNSTLSEINFSNSFRFIKRFFPTKITKLHLGLLEISLILFIPILLYSAASSSVSVTFSHTGTVLFKTSSPPILSFILFTLLFTVAIGRKVFADTAPDPC